MQRLKSTSQTQLFLIAHVLIQCHSHPRRHLMVTTAYCAGRSRAFDGWRQEAWLPDGWVAEHRLADQGFARARTQRPAGEFGVPKTAPKSCLRAIVVPNALHSG